MGNSIINSNQMNVYIDNATSKTFSTNLANKKAGELKDVAEQFEAIFVHQMLKQARQSKLADGMFNSEAQDTFNNMLDMEYSQVLSKKSNFGIADALIKQFQPHLQLKDTK
ncbi:rod-binding protein [Alphaproteobacteria bacterium]|nr:rod-binding protein [Alphaproteobacteria bacterium]